MFLENLTQQRRANTGMQLGPHRIVFPEQHGTKTRVVTVAYESF